MENLKPSKKKRERKAQYVAARDKTNFRLVGVVTGKQVERKLVVLERAVSKLEKDLKKKRQTQEVATRRRFMLEILKAKIVEISIKLQSIDKDSENHKYTEIYEQIQGILVNSDIADFEKIFESNKSLQSTLMEKISEKESEDQLEELKEQQ